MDRPRWSLTRALDEILERKTLLYQQHGQMHSCFARANGQYYRKRETLGEVVLELGLWRWGSRCPRSRKSTKPLTDAQSQRWYCFSPCIARDYRVEPKTVYLPWLWQSRRVNMASIWRACWMLNWLRKFVMRVRLPSAWKSNSVNDPPRILPWPAQNIFTAQPECFHNDCSWIWFLPVLKFEASCGLVMVITFRGPILYHLLSYGSHVQLAAMFRKMTCHMAMGLLLARLTPSHQPNVVQSTEARPLPIEKKIKSFPVCGNSRFLWGGWYIGKLYIVLLFLFFFSFSLFCYRTSTLYAALLTLLQ